MKIIIEFMKLAIEKLYGFLYPYCMEDAEYCFALTAAVVTVCAAIVLWLAFRTIPEVVSGIIYRFKEEQHRRHRMRVLRLRERKRRAHLEKKVTFGFEDLDVA